MINFQLSLSKLASLNSVNRTWIAKTLLNSLRDGQNKTQRPHYDDYKLRFDSYYAKRIRKKGTMNQTRPGILPNIFLNVLMR